MQPDAMTSPENDLPASIVRNDAGKLASLDDLKALLYEFNAKPDTETRLLGAKRFLTLADLRSINDRILAKLLNYDNITSSSINFIMSNKSIKDYSTWDEFEREKWDTVNSTVQAVTIKWDMRIQLPQFKNRQRHSLRCRIGREVAPKDIFQLMMTTDDVIEIMEAQSPCIVKVDFVNDVLANELLNIVEQWYQGLASIPEKSSIGTFLVSKGKRVSEILRMLLPISLLMIARQYLDLYEPLLGSESHDNIHAMIDIGIILTSVFVIGTYFGRKLERFIDSRIDKLERYPVFSISKGDRNAVDGHQVNNRSLSSEIIGRVGWILFGLLVTSIAKVIWSKVSTTL